MAKRADIPSLPLALQTEPPSVKMLYLWLLPQGTVTWSQREIGAAVGITQANVSRAMTRLGEIGLLSGSWRFRGRARGAYRAEPPGCRAGER